MYLCIILVQASSKGTVVQVCRIAFSHRNGTGSMEEGFTTIYALLFFTFLVPASVIANISTTLGIKPVEASKVE